MFSLSLAALTSKDITVFILVLCGLCALMLLKSFGNWLNIHKRGSTITIGEYYKLRWQGIRPGRIAAAEWMAGQVEGGSEISREVWISFYKLGIDVLKLSAAYVAASQAKMTTSIGILGAAALTGLDPMELVQTAHKNGVKVIDTKYVEAQHPLREG